MDRRAALKFFALVPLAGMGLPSGLERKSRGNHVVFGDGTIADILWWQLAEGENPVLSVGGRSEFIGCPWHGGAEIVFYGKKRPSKMVLFGVYSLVPHEIESKWRADFILEDW